MFLLYVLVVCSCSVFLLCVLVVCACCVFLLYVLVVLLCCLCCVVVVVEWLYYSKRIFIVRWADLSDFIFR